MFLYKRNTCVCSNLTAFFSILPKLVITTNFSSCSSDRGTRVVNAVDVWWPSATGFKMSRRREKALDVLTSIFQ